MNRIIQNYNTKWTQVKTRYVFKKISKEQINTKLDDNLIEIQNKLIGTNLKQYLIENLQKPKRKI